MIKKEQFEKLKPFEKHLKTAQGDYVHGLYSRDINVLESVYNELGYNLISRTCAHCLIDMCKILGQEYFKYIERYYEKSKGKNEREHSADNATGSIIQPAED